AAARDDRTPRHARPGAAGGRTRPHRRLAGPSGAVMTGLVATDMLAVTDVVRTFGSGRTATRALRGVSFGVRAGQLVALRGRSGSGDATLVNIDGGLDLPDSGQVRADGRAVTTRSDHERKDVRRSSVALVLQ